MKRQHQLAHRRNALVLASALPESLRTEVRSDRFRGRATISRPEIEPAVRTRFSAALAAFDMAEGRARRIGDAGHLDRETHIAMMELPRADQAAIRRSVRLLHELVPVGDEVVERSHIVAAMEPVGGAETDLWPLVIVVARVLAGSPSSVDSLEPTAEFLAADESYGPSLHRALATRHPLAVLAGMHTAPTIPDRRRFEFTVALFDLCFAHYRVDIDPWTASTDIWRGMYVETLSLLPLELEAHQTMGFARGGAIVDAQALWRREVQPLTRVNAGLRRLARFGADVGDFLLLPGEPRPEMGRLRPATDLFATANLRRLIDLGREVLDDEVELWAWKNMWARGCRPQACLPQIDELLPFADGRWRVLVPKAFSKTGLVVDFVASPIAQLVGWSPDACPSFERALSARDGRVPTLEAGNACRKVRRAWRQLQIVEGGLPDLPDRLSYMTRKLMALWLAQRVSTAVLTRWLSHATSATNYTYSKATIAQVLEIRDRQAGERP